MRMLTVFCLVVAVFLPLHAVAETEGPSGEEVLERVAETVSGGGVLDGVRNRVVKGTYALPGQGLTASLTIYSARPNRNYTVIESEDHVILFLVDRSKISEVEKMFQVGITFL